MRRSCPYAAAALLAASACGPGLGAWVGTWAGSATVNAGRQPVTYPGSLTITESAAVLSFASRARVADAGSTQDFSCSSLASATATDARATFTAPAACDFTVSPADGCSYRATLEAAELNRAGFTLEGTGSGRMTITCSGPGGGISDFAMTLSARRQ